MRGKEYLCAIVGERGILRAEMLRFADEVRSPEAIGLPPRRPADPADLARFAKAIKALKVKSLDRAQREDRRNARIVELAEKKLQAGTDVVPAADDEVVEESSTNVVDLMEVLKQRLQGKLRARAAPASSAGKRAALSADELEANSKAQLYEMAQSIALPGRSAMSKAELIEALANTGR